MLLHCLLASDVPDHDLTLVKRCVVQVRARDYHSNWMTAVACLDEDCYLGAENSYNLFTARKNNDSAADDERNRLEVLSVTNQADRVDAASRLSMCTHTYAMRSIPQVSCLGIVMIV